MQRNGETLSARCEDAGDELRTATENKGILNPQRMEGHKVAVKSLQVLFLGNPGKVDKSFMTFKYNEGQMIESLFLSYLIRTDQGNVLVDAGFHPDDVKRMGSFFGAEIALSPDEYLLNRLKDVNLSPDDIDTIIVSHMHVDHIGWLSEFKNAQLIVQKMEYMFSQEPPYFTTEVFPERYNEAFWAMNWRQIDGDYVLMPGITLLFTPGHSIGHQSVMVDLPETGTIILGLDAVGLQENLDKEIIPTPWSNAREAFLSLKKLKTWAAVRKGRIFPGHDMDFYRREIKKWPDAYV